MRELGEADRDERDRQARLAERPEIGERLLEHFPVVEPRDDHHLTVELDPAVDEARELLQDVRDTRVVEQRLARFPRRRVHRDVERREPVLDDAIEVPLLEVRERGEIPVGERETVVVIPDVERLAQPFRKSLDEAELAAVGAAPHGGGLQLHAEALPFGAFDLVDDRLAVGEADRDLEFIVGGQELPVEKIIDVAPVDGEDLRSGHDLEFVSNAIGSDACDADHGLTRDERGKDADATSRQRDLPPTQDDPPKSADLKELSNCFGR